MAKIFKSVWFRCITVLLLIAVVSGGLLAILNDVLYVSPTERTERAISKIYGEKKTITEDNIKLDVNSSDENKNTAIEYDFGKITKCYELENDLLFQTVGYNGYKNGTITLWIKVTCADEKYSIDKVILESNEKQTLMSKFSDDYYGKFYLTDITDNYQNKFFAPTSVDDKLTNANTGATFSATACCNAVNCVIKYMGERL